MTEIEVFAIVVVITLVVLGISHIYFSKKLEHLEQRFEGFVDISTVVQSHLMKKVDHEEPVDDGCLDKDLVRVLTNLINALKEEKE